MRSVVRLVILGLVMALLHRLTAAGPLEARATLALGFLLLATHPGGELATRAGVPRLTGYLLLGFVVGPAWLGLVRADEVAALGFIADAAVALIALAAGGALRLEDLRGERKGLVRLAAGAMLFPAAAVAVVTLSIAPWFPVTVHQGAGDAIAVALVLGTVAAVSSPAVTMAVTQELGARGPFARSVLNVTVVQDVVAIVLLTLVLAVAYPLASEGALHGGVAWRLLARSVSAVALGGVLGAFVARYLRLVERETPLFLVAVAFCAAEAGRLLGLETLLIALSAGFFIANFAPAEGERLAGDLGRVARPVHMLFFVLAGAGLQMEALRDLWPWVLLLAGLRVWGLRIGLRWAGRDPSVTPAMARHGWLGLISQAGLALGLAAVARRAFPAWGVSLQAFIVAMIGVHELAGTVCLRRALALVGELKEGHDVKDAALVGGHGVGVGGSGV